MTTSTGTETHTNPHSETDCDPHTGAHTVTYTTAHTATPAGEHPEMTTIPACLISAMPEEMAPLMSLLQKTGSYTLHTISSPIGTITEVYSAESTEAAANSSMPTFLLAVTGIGFTATASCLGWLLAHYEPHALFSIGSAGGLSSDARVKEVVLGTRYRDGGADGTAFGYVRGQVPGQPEYFTASAALLAAGAAAALESETIVPSSLQLGNIDIRTGEMLSSDTFVTDANVGDMRDAFPEAVTADMESYAAAHVAHQWGVPFLSVRGISDLCSRPEDQSVAFHAELADVATRSARTALAIIRAAQLV